MGPLLRTGSDSPFASSYSNLTHVAATPPLARRTTVVGAKWPSRPRPGNRVRFPYIESPIFRRRSVTATLPCPTHNYRRFETAIPATAR